jgi:hypothetical protein
MALVTESFSVFGISEQAHHIDVYLACAFVDVWPSQKPRLTHVMLNQVKHVSLNFSITPTKAPRGAKPYPPQATYIRETTDARSAAPGSNPAGDLQIQISVPQKSRGLGRRDVPRGCQYHRYQRCGNNY